MSGQFELKELWWAAALKAALILAPTAAVDVAADAHVEIRVGNQTAQLYPEVDQNRRYDGEATAAATGYLHSVLVDAAGAAIEHRDGPASDIVRW